jgi:hypothetical protein
LTGSAKRISAGQAAAGHAATTFAFHKFIFNHGLTRMDTDKTLHRQWFQKPSAFDLKTI